jgi:hypothetical protein
MSKSKGVTVARLKTLKTKASLICLKCHSEYSADAPDYWNIPDDYVFACCGVPNKLIEKVTIYREVK